MFEFCFYLSKNLMFFIAPSVIYPSGKADIFTTQTPYFFI